MFFLLYVYSLIVLEQDKDFVKCLVITPFNLGAPLVMHRDLFQSLISRIAVEILQKVLNLVKFQIEQYIMNNV